MAYIDNNSGIPSGTGKDPLEELEKELDGLRLTLGEMDDAEPVTTKENAAPPPMENASVPYRETTDFDIEEPVAQSTSLTQGGSHMKKKSSKLPYFFITAVIVLLAAAAAVFLLRDSLFLPPEPTETPTITVSVEDELFGELAIQTVEDAPANTYDEDNLVLDENGLYAYYENGVKVSEVGVDLSAYQADSNIDFDAMKDVGIDFVMLRLGGRFYSEEGGLYSDSSFETFYSAAKAAGLKVGAYFFSQATTAGEAVEEARYSLALLDGLSLDYPVGFDLEMIEDDEARTNDLTGAELTAVAKAFCDEIIGYGYETIVYANSAQMLLMYDFETMKDYEFWLADYRAFPTSEKMYYNFTMWQYTAEGDIDGIDTPVDLNLCLKANG